VVDKLHKGEALLGKHFDRNNLTKSVKRTSQDLLGNAHVDSIDKDRLVVRIDGSGASLEGGRGCGRGAALLRSDVDFDGGGSSADSLAFR